MWVIMRNLNFKYLRINLVFVFCFLGFSSSFAQTTNSSSGAQASPSTSAIQLKAAAGSSLQQNTQGVATNNLINTLGVGGADKNFFRFTGSASYTPQIRNDQVGSGDFLLRGEYFFAKNQRIRLDQYYTHYEQKLNSAYEFKPSDTTIGHFINLPWKLWDGSLQWRTNVTLPISNESARDGIITRVTGSLMYSKMFLDNKFTFLLVPYARYHVTQYKTSPSGNGLPWYTLGASVWGIYNITPAWSLSGIYNYNFEAVQKSQFATTGEIQPDLFPNGSYSFDVGISWQFSDNFSANLGYSQGASYMQQGRYELVFYDNRNSRYNFGLSCVF